jgi:hypothetical protein
MTVATGIEIGALGGSLAGQGPAGLASGSGCIGTASAALQTTIAVDGTASGTSSGTESFRDGLQSLLASLRSAAEGATVKSSGTTPASGCGSCVEQTTKSGSAETAVGAKLSLAAAESGISSARPTAGVARATTTAATTKEKQPETESKKQLFKEGSAVSSVLLAAREVVVTDTASGLLPAAIASPAQPVPADLSSPDSASELPTGIATTSKVPYSPGTEFPGRIAAPAQATAQVSGDQAADEVQTSAKGAELPSSVNTSELPSTALNRTDPPDTEQEVAINQTDGKNVQEADATAAVATHGTRFHPAERSVQSQSTSATAAMSQIPAEPTAAEGQSLRLTVSSRQEASTAVQQSLGGVAMQPLKPMDASSPTLVNGNGTDRLAVAAGTAAAQSEQALPVGRDAEKPSTSIGAKSSVVGVSRSSHQAGKSDTELKFSRLVDEQASTSTSETLAMAREAAGAHGSARPAGELAQTSTTDAAGADSREAFAELDAQDTTGKPTWIHAGTQRAEAGFQDPTLGWVSVRADTSGGGVHAQLVPGSADAAQTLGGHLAGLNAYLTEHHTPVETLTLSAPDGGWTGTGNEQSQGQNMQQGAGQQTRQDADSVSQSNMSGSSLVQRATSAAAIFQRGLDGSLEAARAGGVHISVMA